MDGDKKLQTSVKLKILIFQLGMVQACIYIYAGERNLS